MAEFLNNQCYRFYKAANGGREKRGEEKTKPDRSKFGFGPT
jgi:hypothetical protein